MEYFFLVIQHPFFPQIMTVTKAEQNTKSLVESFRYLDEQLFAKRNSMSNIQQNGNDCANIQPNGLNRNAFDNPVDEMNNGESDQILLKLSTIVQNQENQKNEVESFCKKLEVMLHCVSLKSIITFYLIFLGVYPK